MLYTFFLISPTPIYTLYGSNTVNGYKKIMWEFYVFIKSLPTAEGWKAVALYGILKTSTTR